MSRDASKVAPPTGQRVYEYIIVYSVKTRDGVGVGRTFVDRTGPLESKQDVLDVEGLVREAVERDDKLRVENLFITSFQLLCEREGEISRP